MLGTCHSHSHSRSDPPSRFCVGPVFRFSSGENNKYCRRSGVGKWSPELRKQPHGVPAGPNALRVQPEASVLSKRRAPQWGISDLLWLGKNSSSIQKNTNPQFCISPAKMMIWSSLDVLTKTNKHHWLATPLYYGDDVTRALISPSTALAARNSAYNLRMSETNNSNYYLYRALYMPQALQSSTIPYSKLGMLVRVSPPSVLEANGSVLTRAENRIPKTWSVFSPWCLESKTVVNILIASARNLFEQRDRKTGRSRTGMNGRKGLFWDLYLTPLHEWPENISQVPLLIPPLQ